MNKAVWITLVVSLVLVNVIAELVFYFSGVNIVMLLRLGLVFGITMIAAIFVGTLMLIGKLEQEKPLSGHVKDTLGADRAKDK